ncbi:MAG: DMT family transporter [Anaerolineae bacterium]
MQKPAVNSPRGALLAAIGAALLFGASAPLSKLLLGSIEPIPLAALLYLGSGLCAWLLQALNPAAHTARQEARLARGDLPWLAGSILLGGIAAPIVLLFSLRAVPAATAALLLNFEGIATSLIAVLIFREMAGWRMWGAVGAVTLGSILLSFDPHGAWGLAPGALGIVAACALWGADNNLTRAIADKDPLLIVGVKGLAAGAISLGLALISRQALPAWPAALGALALGAVCYGVSIWLFILALRGLGAARTSALFGTAPFAGAALALLLLREGITWQFGAALPLMLAGAWLLLGERHAHRHLHPSLTHNHRHRHDDGHHTHQHPGLPPETSHAHAHTHEPLEHSHPHLPDSQHRHSH